MLWFETARRPGSCGWSGQMNTPNAQYAEPGIMRNSTAGVARVACRGGDRADAGRGKFRIIAAG